MDAKTCYMCDQPITSREHVPPKCLFPEMKSFGRDVRKNLISVPSCDKHNSEKSRDDEFLRTAFTLLGKVNKAGKHQFKEKTLQGAARSPEIYRAFLRDQGISSTPPGRVLQVDRKQFDRCIGNIARGIAFHELGEKYLHELSVFTPLLFRRSEDGKLEPDALTMRVVALTRKYLKAQQAKGENPEVFMYRMRYDPAEGGFAFAAWFYESLEVFAVPKRALEGEPA